jgi:hypothetical protein
MPELIDNNPQSSCKCYDCADKTYIFNNNGFPTNMSVRNNDFSDYYDCIDKNLFKTQTEPRNLKGYTYINPNAISKSYDKNYQAIYSPGSNKDNTVYITEDPRLISTVHFGQRTELDRPPINEAISLDEIYTNPDMKYYGQTYNTYSDINAGQIMYYFDKSIQDAEFGPIFVNNAKVEGTIFKDPMGAMKPQYNRTPIINTQLLDTKHNNYKDVGLSWIRDSQESREDLIALQMRKHNEQRYEPRWSGNIFF